MKFSALIVLALATLHFQSAFAETSPGFDGCYQLAVTGALYPKFCLQGTMEEGVGGSGARIAIFHTNTEDLIYCAKSTASSLDASGFTFEVNGVKELVLANTSSSNGMREGDATFGHSTFKFFEFDSETTARMMKIMNSDSRCQ
jgi:hypothetical protein